MTLTESMVLTQAPPDTVLTVCSVEGGRGVKSRLAALGIVQGASIRLIATRSRGPYILCVKESRVMVGHGMAERIHVRPDGPARQKPCGVA